MVSKSPWSVKGVSQEDRDQAKTAARRAGLPVGVWLSRQIRSSNTDLGSDSETEGCEPAENADASKGEEPARGAPWRGGPDNRFTFGPGQWSIATDVVADGRISRPPPPQSPPPPWPIARSPVMAPPHQMHAPMQSGFSSRRATGHGTTAHGLPLGHAAACPSCVYATTPGPTAGSAYGGSRKNQGVGEKDRVSGRKP
jgi:hypothetical protein